MNCIRNKINIPIICPKPLVGLRPVECFDYHTKSGTFQSIFFTPSDLRFFWYYCYQKFVSTVSPIFLHLQSESLLCACLGYPFLLQN